MRILMRTTGYCIVKSSDNEDTDVDGWILYHNQLCKDEGYCKDVPVIIAWDNSASCITKMKWDNDVLYVNGLTCDNSASSIIKRNDKALYNNQLDKDLGL